MRRRHRESAIFVFSHTMAACTRLRSLSVCGPTVPSRGAPVRIHEYINESTLHPAHRTFCAISFRIFSAGTESCILSRTKPFTANLFRLIDKKKLNIIACKPPHLHTTNIRFVYRTLTIHRLELISFFFSYLHYSKHFFN